MIGVPDLKALLRVDQKLKDNQIEHCNWEEPDYDYGFTAICTAPLMGEKREVLKKYRVYSPGASNGACLLTEDRGASYPSSSEKERSSLQGTVGG